MARSYTISNGYKTVTRKKYDSAVDQALNMAYETIAGQGGLDTQWGHYFMREVQTFFACNDVRKTKKGRIFFGPHGIKLTFEMEQ